jgi:hypothetical protein
MDDKTRQELNAALDVFTRGMERVAEAYLNEVARVFAATQKSALGQKLELACPDTNPHDRHTWRFADGVVARQCPGVTRPLPVEPCLKTTPHDEHRWEYEPGYQSNGGPGLGRTCLGVQEQGCSRMEATHEAHGWLHPLPGLPAAEASRWCTGSRGPRPCPKLSRHNPHSHRTDLDRPWWCDGRGGLKWEDPVMVPVKRCLKGGPHGPHNWEDPITGPQACPGRMNTRLAS